MSFIPKMAPETFCLTPVDKILLFWFYCLIVGKRCVFTVYIINRRDEQCVMWYGHNIPRNRHVVLDCRFRFMCPSSFISPLRSYNYILVLTNYTFHTAYCVYTRVMQTFMWPIRVIVQTIICLPDRTWNIFSLPMKVVAILIFYSYLFVL